MANPEIDLSFARYVAARKGEASARSREGAAYAYSGDIKVRAALDRIRPVTLAVEATVRLWQSVEKSRMLGTSVKRKHSPGRAGDVPHTLADVSAGKRDLGYDPVVDFDEGLRRTVEFFTGRKVG